MNKVSLLGVGAEMAAPRNYWLINLSLAYHEAMEKTRYGVLGLGKSQKRRTQRMEIGDKVLFYVSSLNAFSAVAFIDSTYFEDHSQLGDLDGSGEEYPWRVRLKPSIVLNRKNYIDARLIAPRMQYVRKWTPEAWPLAFHGLLHLIPKEDFVMLEDEVRKRTLTPQFEMIPDLDAACALDRIGLST